MSNIICPTCGFDENPLGSEFCEACGSELIGVTATEMPATQISTSTDVETNDPPPPNTFSAPVSESVPTDIDTAFNEPAPISESVSTDLEPVLNAPTPTFANTARLISHQAGTPVPEFSLNGSNAIIGRFDPDTGPVEVDLEGFPGEDTISRHHAEIRQEGGQWKIMDLGSTNGVFIKRNGQTRFSARITKPETLNPGDEIAIAKIRFQFQSP